MRDAFADEMTALAGTNAQVVLLSGDIGNRMFNRFKESYPERFLNCGVAEANMTGVAAGLALSGLRPVTYTITPFNTYRCYEQIRLDLCYQNLPVVVVGVGSGLAYSELNATHHSMEDIAVMRALPGMTVLCPGDAMELRGCLRAALRHDGPVYLRVGKKGEPVVHGSVPDIELGRGIVMKPPAGICIVSTGSTLPLAVSAADALTARGLECGLVSLPTVKPLDGELLMHLCSVTNLIVTIEEHSVVGGLGGAVAEWLAEHAPHGRLLSLGGPDRFLHRVGGQHDAWEAIGLTEDAICSRVGQFLGRVSE